MIKYFQKLGSSAGIPTKNRGVTSLKKLGVRELDQIDNIIIKNFLNTFL